jgi:hypothetical protein
MLTKTKVLTDIPPKYYWVYEVCLEIKGQNPNKQPEKIKAFFHYIRQLENYNIVTGDSLDHEIKKSLDEKFNAGLILLKNKSLKYEKDLPSIVWEVMSSANTCVPFILNIGEKNEVDELDIVQLSQNKTLNAIRNNYPLLTAIPSNDGRKDFFPDAMSVELSSAEFNIVKDTIQEIDCGTVVAQKEKGKPTTEDDSKN